MQQLGRAPIRTGGSGAELIPGVAMTSAIALSQIIVAGHAPRRAGPHTGRIVGASAATRFFSDAVAIQTI